MSAHTQIRQDELEANSSAKLQAKGDAGKAAGGLSEGGDSFPRIF